MLAFLAQAATDTATKAATKAHFSFSQLLNSSDILEKHVIPGALKLLSAIVIFVIGRWIAKFIVSVLQRVFKRSKVDVTLSDFLGNIVYALLITVVILAALEQLGVETTSALAILGPAGLAIGLALQSSLANFASGVMLILFRPFRVGDFIEAGGTSGTVESITMFSTIMRTGDNKEVTVPNAHIHKGTIVNFSARSTRRIDLVVNIGYDDNIQIAKKVLETILKNEARILAEPEPVIMVLELASHSIDIAVRPWVNSSDYWKVRGDLLEAIKNAFDDNGISIPYPQQDVHVVDLPSSMTKPN